MVWRGCANFGRNWGPPGGFRAAWWPEGTVRLTRVCRKWSGDRGLAQSSRWETRRTMVGTVTFQILNEWGFLFLLLCCLACGIFIPWPAVAPGAMAMKAPSPNRWTSREFPSKNWTSLSMCADGVLETPCQLSFPSWPSCKQEGAAHSWGYWWSNSWVTSKELLIGISLARKSEGCTLSARSPNPMEEKQV